MMTFNNFFLSKMFWTFICLDEFNLGSRLNWFIPLVNVLLLHAFLNLHL